MKTPNNFQNLPDFDAELDQDPVWNLLDEAPVQEPSPRFAQDLVRQARLEGQGSTPWWKTLFSPKPLIGVATAACACVALVLSFPGESTADPEPIAAAPPAQTDDWEENFADALASELLTSAAEDPSLLSDSEIIALLY